MPASSGKTKFPLRRRAVVWLVLLPVLLLHTSAVAAEETGIATPEKAAGFSRLLDVEEYVKPESVSGTFQTIALLAILSLAPAIALMTTSFVRIVIVLGILRQAIGAPQIPSTQIVTALALFMSFLIMMPVWTEVRSSVDPYISNAGEMTLSEAWEAGSRPVKRFMSRQIAVAGNADDILLFYSYLPEAQRENTPETYADVPLQVLLPAFMISELKVAFLIGFQIFMPFLVVDLVVTSVTTSMGMVMLPPTMISLPLKLVLFVLADGWHLIVAMLMNSFAITA
jgi:flagellar biosynthetic protein FliP